MTGKRRRPVVGRDKRQKAGSIKRRQGVRGERKVD